MAQLPYSAKLSDSSVQRFFAGVITGVHVGGLSDLAGASGARVWTFGARRDLTGGVGGGAALFMPFRGVWRVRWLVSPGVRHVFCKVRQSSAVVGKCPPELRVRKNPAVGLATDLVARAAGEWVGLGPLTFTATASGVVWVELRNRSFLPDTPAWWDDLTFG